MSFKYFSLVLFAAISQEKKKNKDFESRKGQRLGSHRHARVLKTSARDLEGFRHARTATTTYNVPSICQDCQPEPPGIRNQKFVIRTITFYNVLKS